MPRSLSRNLLPLSKSTRRRWSADDASTVLEQLESSGLSVREFAARANLNVQRLYRWRAQLGPGHSNRPSFVEVRPTASATIEVLLRSGHVVRVPDGFDDAALQRLVTVLERVPGC